MARKRNSTVGDWASVVNQLHGAYSDSKIREMDMALKNLQMEAKEKENSAQRQHDFALLDKKSQLDTQRTNDARVNQADNLRFQKWSTDENGKRSLDTGATLNAISEHAEYFSLGSTLNTPTFIKANAFYGMDDATPGFQTEEDIMVMDEYFQDSYMKDGPGTQEESAELDKGLISMGLLGDGETYSFYDSTGPPAPGDKAGIDRETMGRRYNAFKEGIRKNTTIYKNAAEYDQYAASAIETDLKLQSAVYQTEESKAIQTKITALPGTLKSLLTGGTDPRYKIDTYGSSAGKKQGTSYYKLSDKAWHNSSNVARLIDSGDVTIELDRIISMKMKADGSYTEWKQSVVNEGVWDTVNNAVLNREAQVKLHVQEKEDIGDMLKGRKDRQMKRVAQGISTGRQKNEFRKVSNAFYDQAKIAITGGGGKKEVSALLTNFIEQGMDRGTLNSILKQLEEDMSE